MKLLFDAGNQIGPKLAIFAAAAQAPLWANLAHWSATDLREEADVEPKASTPTTSTDKPEMVLASLPKRLFVGSVCLMTGCLFIAGASTYTSRLVKKVSLQSVRTGMVDIETYGLWKSKISVHSKDLRCLERVDPNGNNGKLKLTGSLKERASGPGNKVYVVLHHHPMTKNYLLSRDGTFVDPKTFDSLFYSKSFK
ncbi:UNVERIFIED_CONTAM: hypothetical protein HDU68_005387 [Siphonaria sp. JEL0065]|nr:hypothetical protein HDU68_005387 [Siphonaria sp. JEL0065]